MSKCKNCGKFIHEDEIVTGINQYKTEFFHIGDFGFTKQLNGCANPEPKTNVEDEIVRGMREANKANPEPELKNEH